MKKQRLFLSVIAYFIWVSTPSVFGQQCHDYACVIAKVEKLMKQPQKNYKAILDNLDSAEGYTDNNPKKISKLRDQTFKLIETEQINAIKQKKISKEKVIEASVAQLRADSIVTYDKSLTAEIELLKNVVQKSDSLLVIIELQKVLIEQNLDIINNSRKVSIETIQDKVSETKEALQKITVLIDENKNLMNNLVTMKKYYNPAQPGYRLPGSTHDYVMGKLRPINDVITEIEQQNYRYSAITRILSKKLK